jgi:7tm Chemosensory receptor
MRNIFSEELNIFVNFFQVLSLFPCSNNAFANIMLKFYSSLNLLMVIGIFCSAFFLYPVLQDTESLSLLVGGLVFIGLLLTQSINLLQAYFSRKEQMMIYQKMDEIDHLLQNQLLVNINYGRLRRKLLIKYSIILATLLAIHTASIASVLINGTLYRYHLHLILPIFIIRIRCMQNMFYVDLIKEKLNLMNGKLDDIVRKHKDKLTFILFADKIQKFDKKGTKDSVYEQLMTLKQVYGKTWDVCNLINDCFGWSLLAIVEFHYERSLRMLMINYTFLTFCRFR